MPWLATVTQAQHDERGQEVNDIPNFAAWSNENLAKFAKDSYLRMQVQQDAIMQLQGDFKDAMVELRKRPSASFVDNKSLAPRL